MKALIGCCCATLALALTGCGLAQKSAAPPTGPLTLAEWQTLDVEQKYAPETFDRLKLGDAKLQDPGEWDNFFASVIVPHRKKDIPLGPAKR